MIDGQCTAVCATGITARVPASSGGGEFLNGVNRKNPLRERRLVQIVCRRSSEKR
jgi:hypothetical protein